MPKFEVTHADGRVTEVHSDSEANAKQQALHQQTSEIEMIKGRRNKGSTRPEPPPVSVPVSVVKVKD